jgi:hypothetical protein
MGNTSNFVAVNVQLGWERTNKAFITTEITRLSRFG